MLPGAWNALTLLSLDKSRCCCILTPFSARCLIIAKDFIILWYKGDTELWAWSFLWGTSRDHLHSPVISNLWAQEWSWQSLLSHLSASSPWIGISEQEQETWREDPACKAQHVSRTFWTFACSSFCSPEYPSLPDLVLLSTWESHWGKVPW